MSRRVIEIFSAGCPVCNEAVEMVQKAACPSCEVVVLDMNDPNVAARARSAARAKSFGIRSVPAVAIDGVFVGCCAESGPDLDSLKAAGLGQAI